MLTPDNGIFRKVEYKVEFACMTHIACDKNGFILGVEVTPGNAHDSKLFDKIYEKQLIEYHRFLYLFFIILLFPNIINNKYCFHSKSFSFLLP